MKILEVIPVSVIKYNEIVLERKMTGPYPDSGYIDEIKKVYEFDENGFPTGEPILIKDTITVTWELADINWFAGQHIEASYPLWKQSNITQAGGDELTKMKAFIDAVRAWANQDPLPDPWDGSLESITP